MIIRAGFQRFDLQRSFELPKPLTFDSHDDALKWLKQVASLYPVAINGFRTYLTRLTDDVECARLTDHDAVDRIAELLYTRKVVIVMREEGSGGSGGTPTPAAPPIAFPLAERAPRTSTAPPPAPAADPPTFDQRNDAVVQAAALVAAASDGKPFCEECGKAKAAAAARTSNG